MIDLDKISETPHLLDILLQMEDVLDSLDLYVFKNWFKGEVVDGPRVRRYWFDMSLRYPRDKMPEPRGAMRLVKHGLRVDFGKVTLSDKQVDEGEETDDKDFTHWEVRISIPRRLISDMNAAELDAYDEDVEVEDVQDAQDSGMSEETAYENGEDDEPAEEGEQDEDVPQF